MKPILDVIKQHRSIRHYLPKPIPQEVMQKLLEAATRASTVGTMQLYSIIVTTDEELKKQLAPCHFNQPMATQAPAVVTFCADVARFEQWCRQRDAEPEYSNFMWFMNATIDALLASENFAIEAENQSLGICYLGTTLYTADKIAHILELPKGVVPVATVVVGYPDPEKVPHTTTQRLPMEAVVHMQKYAPYSPEQIDDLWRETEQSEQTKQLIKENNLPNLAQIFTLNRYKKEDNLLFSEKYLDHLRKQGFIK